MKLPCIVSRILALAISVAPVYALHAAPGDTTLLASGIPSSQATGSRQDVGLEVNGSYVAYISDIDDVANGDSNGTADVFVRDLASATGTKRITGWKTDGSIGLHIKSVSVSNGGGRIAYIVTTGAYYPYTWELIVHDMFADTNTTVYTQSTFNLDQPEDSPTSMGAWASVVAYFDNNDLVLKNTATGAVTTLVSKPAGAGTDGYVGAAGPVGVQVLSSGGLVLLDTVKDLLPGDRNHLQGTHDESGSDVYMLDTVNNTADLVSVGTDGIAGTGQSSAASSSETGRFVAFQSDSDGFVAGDSGYSDIFVRDRLLHTTERVSVSLTGGQANGSSTHPHISGDGRYVEFRSTASNLVANDTNDHADVFIYDRRTHATQRISVGLNGQQLNVDSDAQPLPYSPLFALFTAEGANGRQDLFQHQLSIEPYERVYRSYDLQLSTTNPQGFVIPMDGWPAATVDFYESSNDFGVFQGFAPGVYTAGVHPYDFNRVAPYWSANGYFPYVGKSDVGRGADENEGNAVAPFGVRDLQMHPPADDHNMVAVFTVPETGHYSVSDLGARRVAAGGETSRLQLFNKLGVLIASVVAGNDQAWVHSNTTYDLGTLLTGEKIYFAVGRDGDWELDATEISWEIVATELFH